MDESLAEALMIAAARQRQAAVGGRQEGAATALLDKLGTGAYKAAAGPSRLINSLMGYQPGQSVEDRPETMAILPEVASEIVGLPGITGGVPANALGAAMSRNGMIENQDLLKRLALERRNKGEGGSTVRVYDSQGQLDRARGANQRGTMERNSQEAQARYRAQQQKEKDAANSTPYQTVPEQESLSDLFKRYKDPANEDTFFANKTDPKTAMLLDAAKTRKQILTPDDSGMGIMRVPRYATEGQITAYGNKIDNVPLDWLRKMPGNEIRSWDKVDELARAIEAEGIREPLIINAGKESRTAKLGEGNHRLEALWKLGYDAAPARVIVGQNYGKELMPRSFYGDDLLPVPGEYFSADAAPSQVFRSLSNIFKAR